MKKVFTKDERKDAAVKAGLKMARKIGVSRVSVSAVAREIGVSGPLLFHIFGNRLAFHRILTAAAKKQSVALPTAKPTVRAKRFPSLSVPANG